MRHWLTQFIAMPDMVFGILKKVNTMALDISKLQADVAAEADAVQSAVTLLNGLTAAIADLKNQTNDPAMQAAIDDLAGKVESQKQALSDAIVANTPAQNPALNQP